MERHGAAVTTPDLSLATAGGRGDRHDGHGRYDGTALLPWWPQPLSVERLAVSGDAYSDTLSTLGGMACLIRDGAQHPVIQQAARAAIAGQLPSSRRDIAAAVHSYLKSHVSFVQDEERVAAMARLSGFHISPNAELLIAPWELLQMDPPMGDCDEFTTAGGAMLRALGVPVEMVIIAADPERPSDFTHVYLRVILEDGSRLPFDASHGPTVGWEAPRAYRREVWPVFNAARTTGLNGLGFSLPTGITVAPPGTGGWSSVLQNVVTAGASTGFSILGAKLGQPATGTYIQTKEGTYYRGAPGDANLPFPPVSAAGGGTWVMLGAGVLLLMLVMGRR